jgi:hypothetical protein
MSGPGQRDDAFKVIILVTDGEPSDTALALQEAEYVRNNGTYLFVMGYGDAVQQPAAQQTLLDIAGGDPYNVLLVKNASEYSSAAFQIRIATEYVNLFCFQTPTTAPTKAPTKAPSNAPTKEPTKAPTIGPSAAPTAAPTAEPSAMPTATPTAEPTTEEVFAHRCLSAKTGAVDWYFLLDTSSSIETSAVDSAKFTDFSVTPALSGSPFPGYTEAAVNYDSAIRALKTLTNLMLVGPGDGFKVGLTQWSNEPIPEWGIQNYSTKKTSLLTAFDGLKWRGGSTYADKAIEYATERLMEDGDSPNKILYLVTDGLASDLNLAQAAADKARQAGILVYVIGYGAELALSTTDGKPASERTCGELSGSGSANLTISEYATQHMCEISGSFNSTVDRYFHVEDAHQLFEAMNNSIASLCVDFHVMSAPPTMSPTKYTACNNGIQDGTESDIDCGGNQEPSCPRCVAGKKCETGTDCETGGCAFVQSLGLRVCASASPTKAPTASPTTEVPTPSPTNYLKSDCFRNKKVDWFYLLDSSSSIEKDADPSLCNGNPKYKESEGYAGPRSETPNFASVVASLKDQTSSMTIGDADFRVGLAQFSTEPMPEWGLSKYHNDTTGDLLGAFDKLQYRCGGTSTDAAIAYGQAQLTYPTGPGAREDAFKVIMLVTDGIATNNRTAQLAADYAKGNGTVIYVIGYGDEVYGNDAAEQTLRGMATDDKFYISVPSATEIFDAMDGVTKELCATTAIPTSSPTASPTRYPTHIPSCRNGKRDAQETGTDCGGPACPKCGAGQLCDTDIDCEHGVCANQVCTDPPTPVPTAVPTSELEATCNNNLHNKNTESDVDCGGMCAAAPILNKCGLSKFCEDNQDCVSGHCFGAVCASATPAPTIVPVGFVTSTVIAVSGFNVTSFQTAQDSFKATIAFFYAVPVNYIISIEVSSTPFRLRRLARRLASNSAGRVLATASSVYVRFQLLSDLETGAAQVKSTSTSLFSELGSDADTDFVSKFSETMAEDGVTVPVAMQTTLSAEPSYEQYTAYPTAYPTEAPSAVANGSLSPVSGGGFWEEHEKWLLPTVIAVGALIFLFVLKKLIRGGGSKEKTEKKEKKGKREKKGKGKKGGGEGPSQEEIDVKNRSVIKGPALTDALERVAVERANAFKPGGMTPGLTPKGMYSPNPYAPSAPAHTDTRGASGGSVSSPYGGSRYMQGGGVPGGGGAAAGSPYVSTPVDMGRQGGSQGLSDVEEEILSMQVSEMKAKNRAGILTPPGTGFRQPGSGPAMDAGGGLNSPMPPSSANSQRWQPAVGSVVGQSAAHHSMHSPPPGTVHSANPSRASQGWQQHESGAQGPQRRITSRDV